MRKWTLTVFIAVSLVWVACMRTDGFSPSVITAPLLTKEALPVPDEIYPVLSQQFHYLSKGRQCFVFESADGKYVLKFFNQKYLHLPWYSFLKGGEERGKRALRRHFFENSYEIAYKELGDEIVYLHLTATQALPAIQLFDKGGGEHSLDLNQFPFVLQKKGDAFYPTLEAIYAKEGIEGLYREIDSFIGAISKRVEKNIADWDRDVEHNWGYVDGHLFHLDPGRLFYDDFSDPAYKKMEWERATHSFHKWLSVHYPEAAVYLKNRSADSSF